MHLTSEEYARLQHGDKVEVYLRTVGWVRAVVQQGFSPYPFLVKPLELTPAGNPRPALFRDWTELRWPLSPVTANVYADWLLDHDEPAAAAKLREAFPLEDGKDLATPHG